MIRLKWWLLLALSGAMAANAQQRSVNLYHWSGYIPPAILKQFTLETGIQVYATSYDSNEVLYTKLKAMPSHGYDVIMPSSYAVDRMIQEKMLLPIDRKKIPSIDTIDSVWLSLDYDTANTYSLPFLFSSTGLVVNRRFYTTEKLTRWQELWHPRFKAKLLLLDDVRELFAVACFKLGLSPNTLEHTHLQKAYQSLRELVKNTRVFNSEGTFDLYASEEVTAGMGWSGDVYRAQQLNPDLQFIYPEEGYIVSIDNLAIPKNAEHLEEAYALIRFLLREDIAAQISQVTGYGTTVTQARVRLPECMENNPIIYPSLKTLERGIILSSQRNKSTVYAKYWEQLKIE